MVQHCCCEGANSPWESGLAIFILSHQPRKADGTHIPTLPSTSGDSCLSVAVSDRLSILRSHHVPNNPSTAKAGADQ